MTIKGVNLKSESCILISLGALELWRKTLGFCPPPPAWIELKITFLVSEQNDTCGGFLKTFKIMIFFTNFDKEFGGL